MKSSILARLTSWLTPGAAGEPAVIEAAAAEAKAPSGLLPIVSAGVDQRWQDQLPARLQPARVMAILRDALGGDLSQKQALWELMVSSWPRLSTNVTKLGTAVACAPWKWTAWADDGEKPTPTAEERQSFCDRAFWRMRPDPAEDLKDASGTLRSLAMAWLCGHVVEEIHWMDAGADILPRGCKTVPARYWGYPIARGTGDDRRDRFMFRRQPWGQTWEDWPEDQFLLSIAKAHNGHATVAARFDCLARWWVLAVYGPEWLSLYAEKFGIPATWATYTDDRAFPAVQSMLRSFGANRWGAFPAGTTINTTPAATGTATLPQVLCIELADKVCDILVLGATLTTDTGSGGGGAYALGEVHAGVQRDHLQAVCDHVGDILTHQLARSLCRQNFGDDAESPECYATLPEPVDEKAMAERDEILFRIPGFKMQRDEFYRRHNVTPPEDGDEVMEGRAQQPPPSDLRPPTSDQQPQPTAPAPVKAREAVPPGDDARRRALIRQQAEELLLRALQDGSDDFDRQTGGAATPPPEGEAQP